MDITASNDPAQNSVSLSSSDIDSWAQLDVSSLFGLQMSGDSLMGFLENRDSASVGEADRTELLANIEMPMQTDTAPAGISEGQLINHMATSERQEMEEASPARPSTTSALIDLSRQNEVIARQISELSLYPWRSPQMEKYCSENTHLIEGNPIAQALQSTAKFITTLRGLVSSRTPSLGDSHPTTPIPTPSSDSGVSMASGSMQTEPGINSDDKKSSETLSVSVLLLILSTYLQQLQLWSSLLGRAYELLRILPSEVFESFHAPSDFHVTGLPGMKGRLYGKIMIHVVQDQLSTVDRLLALPFEYRLNEKTPTSQPEGIFSNPAFSEILNIAMAEPDATCENTGKALIVSLRETLRRILDVLSD